MTTLDPFDFLSMLLHCLSKHETRKLGRVEIWLLLVRVISSILSIVENFRRVVKASAGNYAPFRSTLESKLFYECPRKNTTRRIYFMPNYAYKLSGWTVI